MERHERASSKPVLRVELQDAFRDELLVSTGVSSEKQSRRIGTTSISGRVHASEGHATAYKLMVKVQFYPMFRNYFASCRWFGEKANWLTESISVPSLEPLGPDTIYAIRDGVNQSFEKSVDLIPGLSAAFLIGFTIEGTSIAILGEQIVKLPCGGILRFMVLNDQYGILAEASRPIYITAWDDVDVHVKDLGVPSESSQ